MDTETLKVLVAETLSRYHTDYPLRQGIPRDELRTLLNLPPFEFNQLLKTLKAEGVLKVKDKWVALPTHRVWFSPFELAKIQPLIDQFAAAPFSPPSVRDARNEVGRELYARLLECGDLVQVSDEVVFRKSDYETMRSQTLALIEKQGQATAAQVRDLFGNSRKYTLALLEHFEKLGITVRDGSFHKLPSQVQNEP